MTDVRIERTVFVLNNTPSVQDLTPDVDGKSSEPYILTAISYGVP